MPKFWTKTRFYPNGGLPSSPKASRKRPRRVLPTTVESLVVIMTSVYMIMALALLPRSSSFLTTTTTVPVVSRSHCYGRSNHLNPQTSRDSNPQKRNPRTRVRRNNMPDDWNSEPENDDENENSDENEDSNEWVASVDEDSGNTSLWSTFESSEEVGISIQNDNGDDDDDDEDDANLVDDSEVWLDTIAAISAGEIEFNQNDNERADKARKMQEWGFDEETIKNTFDVAIDDSKETADEPIGLEGYRKDIYETDAAAAGAAADDEEYEDIESHTRVEVDPETGDTVRQQMVYVDEHSCIGCTNCATIADSTFLMESWHGRARVFRQWGDTEDTIAMAIETCPVDCIHYVEYSELETLEVGRRTQKINNQARLVNQGEAAHMAGIAGGGFSLPQQISGNAKSRCNNCPSNGCGDCPMFGVGKNPEFEHREQKRLATIERRKLDQERAANNKVAEL